MKDIPKSHRRQHWPTPDHNSIGTPRQHFDAIDLYLADPSRHIDRDGSWALAWQLAVTLPRRRAEVRT